MSHPTNPSRRMTLQATAATAALGLLGSSAPSEAEAQTVLPAANVAAFRFRIGGFMAVALGDGQATWPAYPTYASNATQQELQRSLSANYMDTQNYTLNFNALFVDTGKHRVLIDTGAGSELGPELGRLAANLAAAGIAPSTVDAIVLTHAHPDHIGGLVGANSALVFPKAQVFIAEAEWAQWTAPTLEFGGMTIPDGFKDIFRKAAGRHLGAIRRDVIRFKPGSEVLPGISTIAAYGHTAGHCAIRVASGNSVLIHVGDAFHSQAFDLDNPKWATAFDLDPQQAFASRLRLLDQATADKTLLMAYHMPFPGLGRIRKVGDRYAWFATPWLFSGDADPTVLA